jgi:hypothetical protein
VLGVFPDPSGGDRMKRRDAAQALALIGWIRQQLKRIEATYKDSADVPFVGEKIAGSVLGEDGKPVVVSYTQHCKNSDEFRILDEDAFVAWVQERYPTEIVTTVRKSFLDNVLKPSAFQMGALIDNDGEACQSVEVWPGGGYLRTNLVKGADDAIAPLLASLSLADLIKAIEEEVDQPTELDQEAS